MKVLHQPWALNVLIAVCWLHLESCAIDGETEPANVGPADVFFGASEEAITAEMNDENAAPFDVLEDCDGQAGCSVDFSVSEEDEEATGVTIPVRFVIFRKSGGRGVVNDQLTEDRVRSELQRYIAALNGAFAAPLPSPFQFSLDNSDIILDTAPLDPVEFTASEAFRWTADYLETHPGTEQDNRMMVYVFPSLEVSGFTSLGSRRALRHSNHGVYLESEPLWRQPRELIAHEVGHWLGLQHTYRGGCLAIFGDGVSDTANHRTGIFGFWNVFGSCDGTLDTCPTGDTDPVWNLMNYTDCPNRRFSQGQISRMARVWRRHYASRFD